MKRKIRCDCLLFVFGGVMYGLVELIWRRHTHWSMVLTGGLCFLLLYRIFKKVRDCSVCIKCVIGSTVITTMEFFAGFLFNYCLKMKVWDYSGFHFNFCGQICLLYSFLWGLLTLPVLMLCGLLERKWKL